jgi:hypothetical protein
MASEFKRPISPERYAGRPFLRLLDCYVLDTISQLDTDQSGALKDMETKLQKTFDSTGTWQQIEEEQMDFMPTVPEKIRAFWAG